MFQTSRVFLLHFILINAILDFSVTWTAFWRSWQVLTRMWLSGISEEKNPKFQFGKKTMEFIAILPKLKMLASSLGRKSYQKRWSFSVSGIEQHATGSRFVDSLHLTRRFCLVSFSLLCLYLLEKSLHLNKHPVQGEKCQRVSLPSFFSNTRTW